jgi:two-component system, OmpR family, phosphate regulon sensor histidine kinase PhoR
MSTPAVMLGVLVTVALAGFSGFACWQLVRLRRAVDNLASGAEFDSRLLAPGFLQGVYRSLRRIKEHQQGIVRQIEDQDFNLQAILGAMVEGVVIIDAEQRIQLINQRLINMFSLPLRPVGRTVMETFRNHLVQGLVKRTLLSDEPQFEELQAVIQEGAQSYQKHFQISSLRLRPPEKERASGALLIFHEVSQLRSLETVRKEFVANVSHELRTPLSIFNGYLETLIDGETDPEVVRRFLQIMYKHAQRLNLLVEDLLALAQLESQKLSLRLEPTNIRDCVQRVLERLETLITAVQAEVLAEVPDSLPLVQADPLRLEQVLSNLIDNALKYGSRPGTKVVVSASRDKQELLIQVRDNGPGIPLVDQPHIFERFYRVHKDRSRDAGGTGIGLSIVKHTVQAHGGTVDLESRPGEGAAFIVRLPLQKAL